MLQTIDRIKNCFAHSIKIKFRKRWGDKWFELS